MLPLFIYAPLRFSTNRGVAKTANISETSTVMTTNKKKRKKLQKPGKVFIESTSMLLNLPQDKLGHSYFFEIGVVFYPLRTMTL